MADALKHAERRDAQNNIETLPNCSYSWGLLKTLFPSERRVIKSALLCELSFLGREMREQFITFGVQAD